jgi:riboflavin biosynthesis pyrimidine reductase
MARHPVIVCADENIDRLATMNCNGSYWLTLDNCKMGSSLATTSDEKSTMTSSINRLYNLLKAGATVLRCKATPTAHVDLDDMTCTFIHPSLPTMGHKSHCTLGVIVKLGERFASLMVEGGASIISAFLATLSKSSSTTPTPTPLSTTSSPATTIATPSMDTTSLSSSSLINQIIITIAPTMIGGLKAVDQPLSTTNVFPRLKNVTFNQLGVDCVCRGDL